MSGGGVIEAVILTHTFGAATNVAPPLQKHFEPPRLRRAVECDRLQEVEAILQRPQDAVVCKEGSIILNLWRQDGCFVFFFVGGVGRGWWGGGGLGLVGFAGLIATHASKKHD